MLCTTPTHTTIPPPPYHTKQQVPAGAMNHDGILVIETTHLASDSTPARIARLTSTAQATKPQLRRSLDDFGEWYSKVRWGGVMVWGGCGGG